MSEMPRFLVDRELAGPGEYELDRQESHHAAHVLRLRVGSEAIIFDGKGNYGFGLVTRIDKNRVSIGIDAVQVEKKRPVQIAIATGIPKGKRWQILVEKCTELGVDMLIPILSGRSVVKGEGNPDRWRRWAVEAAKQSRRSFLPEILEPLKLHEALSFAKRETMLTLLADPDGEAPRTFQPQIREKGKVLVLIGPEGGFTGEEIKLYEREGVAKMRLSPFILRIETAAATACALIREM